MIAVTRRYRFCASHRLHSDRLTEAENSRTYGKCNNPYGHGHDYVLDVSVTGEVNPSTGLIVRLGMLDKFVMDEILSRFDHRNLNTDLAEFAQLVPTTENLALIIADRLSEKWSDYFPDSLACLSAISVQETDRNSFEVLLPKEASRLRSASVESNESVMVNV